MEQYKQYMDDLSDTALIEAMELYERGEDPMDCNDDDCLLEAMEAYERDIPMEDTNVEEQAFIEYSG